MIDTAVGRRSWGLFTKSPGEHATLERRETSRQRTQTAHPAITGSLTTEYFRGIYTRAGAGIPETLAVCSTIGGEGKTTIALGLATTIAQDFPELRVALVETDLAHPILARDFNVESTPGLAECLADDGPVILAKRPTSIPNLHLIPAGAGAPGLARLVRASRMNGLLTTLRAQHDIIILDLPAVLVNSDALLLSELADGVVFVVRAGVTPRSLVQKALAQLDPTKIRGIVLNGTESAIPSRLRAILGL